MLYKKGLVLSCIFRTKIRTKMLAEGHCLLIVPKAHAYPAEVCPLDKLTLVDPIPS